MVPAALALVSLFVLAGGDRPLVPGRPLEAALSGKDAHSYEITLEAGQFLRLTVVQDGIDVVVTLAMPEGRPLEVDVASGHQGREPVSILAGRPGEYRIEVRPKEPGAAPGRYLLESEPARAATAPDRRRINGERALAEAVRLSRGDSAELRRQALARFEDALAAWPELSDRYWEAETRLDAAATHAALSEFGPALDEAAAALAQWREMQDRAGQARALQLVGEIRHFRSDEEQARDAWSAALALRRELGDRRGEAETLTSLGLAYAETGDAAKALETGTRALALWRAIGERRGEGAALGNLGEIHVHRAEIQEGMSLFMEALSLHQALGDRVGEARMLADVGYVQQILGDLRGGLEYFRRALRVWRELGDRFGEASTLNNIGYIHLRLQEYDRALEHYERALELRAELGDRRGQAYVLVNLAAIYSTRGDREKALANQLQALQILHDIGDRAAEGITLMNVGMSSAELGRTEEARRHYEQALTMKRALGDRLGESVTLYLLGRLEHEAGDLSSARAALEQALDITEAESRRLTVLRFPSAFRAGPPEMYERYLDVLIDLHERHPEAGFDGLAFRASERARARALLELLREARAGIREGVDRTLLDEERSLRDRLGGRLDAQMRLLGTPHSEDKAREAAWEVQKLTTELESVQARLTAKSPRYAALQEPAVLTPAELQKDVLDDDTVLLEYALGTRRSFLWVVRRSALTVHVLPPRKEIEEAAGQTYRQLARRRPGTAAGAEARLSRMVLGPATDALRTRRLLVVADGALHYVPFGALPDPVAGGPLVLRHEIVTAPSASVIAELRREGGRGPAARKTLAVFADPVFDPNDERVRGAGGGTAPTVASADRDVDRAARAAGLEAVLPRLPFTGEEARAILALVPRGEGKAALAFEASRAAATDPSLGDYRIIHFATHGFLNGTRPELSGIVLSLVDRQGRSERGFLTTADVFNLRLGAELVVLSGCRTALGDDVKGEGLVGLPRGFMYAGAPRVLASLWNVDDESTAVLMTVFYREMLGPARQRPAAALRAAQLSLRRSRRWRAPYYWAGFELQGDWR